MATQILGKVAYTSRGAYDSSFSYEINDVVTYNGSSYVSLKETKGNLPTNENYWMLLAQKGDTYEVTEDDLNNIANQITEDANSSFNQNVETKTEEFNTNASNKTDEFNSNVTSKTETFNTNAETKLNEYNTNATSKVNTYDENATTKLSEYNANADTRLQEFNDNADSYNERITANENDIAENTQRTRRIENNIFESGEATGESINIQDSVLSELTGFRAKAVNTQKNTTGKNLLDFSKYSSKSVYTTIDFTDDVLTVSNSQGTYQSITYDIAELCSQNLGKTLSFNYEDFSYDVGALAPTVQIMTRYNDSSSIKYDQLLLTSGARGKFDIPEDISNISSIMLRIMPNNSSTDGANTMVIEKPMLFLGSNTDNPEYEPFTNGASPSPEFPQNIPVMKDGEDVEFKSIGKNFLNLTASTSSLNNVEPNIENGNEIKLSGTPTQTWANITAITYKNIEKGTYTFSIKESTQVCSVSLYTVSKSGVVREYQIPKGTLQKKVTFTEDVRSYRVYIFNMTAGTEIDTTLHLQLERGDTATEYEPYVESKLTTSVPEGEFVGATDTTADEFYTEYNEEDKKEHIYLAKNIGRRILNGTENWVMNYGTGMFHLTASIPTKIRQVLCSHFKYNTVKTGIYNTLVNGECATNGEPTAKNIYFKYTAFSTVAEWKAYLAEQYANGNPIIVQYESAEPYVIDLGAVDQLKTWTDVTNILNNSPISFNMTANYYRNFISTIRNLQVNNGALQTELADLESRLSALETSVSNLQTSQVNESEVVEDVI